jgi:hypothetical protein
MGELTPRRAGERQKGEGDADGEAPREECGLEEPRDGSRHSGLGSYMAGYWSLNSSPNMAPWSST